MREKWSFLEDAVDQIGVGNVDKGRAAVVRTLEPIERWLIETYIKRDRRSSSWLLLLVSASVALLVSVWVEPSFSTFVLILFALAGASGYIYEKTFYQRLVQNVRRGKPAPEVFTDESGKPAHSYVTSMFSTSRMMFDSSGKPARLTHKATELDLVWLISINEAEPLKRALCGTAQFPVAILCPEREIVTPTQPEYKTQQSVTYNFTQETYVDQRQLHVHASTASSDSKTPKAARPTKSKAAANITSHWLYQLDKAAFEERYASFEEHLPGTLKWMSLVIHQAYPVVQRHKGWTDAKLLVKILENISALRATSDHSKSLPAIPDSGTIKKMFNRGRADPAYRWVREYFTDHRRPHKYQDIDQDRLPL